MYSDSDSDSECDQQNVNFYLHFKPGLKCLLMIYDLLLLKLGLLKLGLMAYPLAQLWLTMGIASHEL